MKKFFLFQTFWFLILTYSCVSESLTDQAAGPKLMQELKNQIPVLNQCLGDANQRIPLELLIKQKKILKLELKHKNKPMKKCLIEKIRDFQFSNFNQNVTLELVIELKVERKHKKAKEKLTIID